MPDVDQRVADGDTADEIRNLGMEVARPPALPAVVEGRGEVIAQAGVQAAVTRRAGRTSLPQILDGLIEQGRELRLEETQPAVIAIRRR